MIGKEIAHYHIEVLPGAGSHRIDQGLREKYPIVFYKTALRCAAYLGPFTRRWRYACTR